MQETFSAQPTGSCRVGRAGHEGMSLGQFSYSSPCASVKEVGARGGLASPTPRVSDSQGRDGAQEFTFLASSPLLLLLLLAWGSHFQNRCDGELNENLWWLFPCPALQLGRVCGRKLTLSTCESHVLLLGPGSEDTFPCGHTENPCAGPSVFFFTFCLVL